MPDTTVETTPRDRANASYSLFLRTMAGSATTAGDIAKAMEVSDSKVSEIKNKQMQDCLLLLAHLGLKVVPAEFECMAPETHRFVSSHVRMAKVAPHILFGSEVA
jgi:hypothetical protein